jgi:hypothetical protein
MPTGLSHIAYTQLARPRGSMRHIGIALAVGAALVAAAGLIALVAGSDRFFQACAVIAVICLGATVVMSGVLFAGGSYPSRAAMTQLPAPADDAQADDPVDPETRSRLNSVYPLIAGLPCIVIAAMHYL